MRLLNLTTLIILSSLIISACDGNKYKHFVDDLSLNEKSLLCKTYIGVIFGRSPEIMDSTATGSNVIEVTYIRDTDKSVWNNRCQFNADMMVWSSWIISEQKWGRWRTEDQVKLEYNKEIEEIMFYLPRYGEVKIMR